MKHALITGASSGIGLQLVISYLTAGWHVTACGRDEEKLKAALGNQTEHLRFCIFNISNRQDVLRNTVQLKKIDLAIFNAGTCEYIDDPQSFDGQLFERVIQNNVIGTGFCLESILPKINVGGQLGIVSSSVTTLPLTRAEAYGASKSALDYLARTLAIDLAPKNIDVSLIRPGFVDTPLTQKNTFKMPGIMSVEQAATLIIKGLHQRKLEINFPHSFFYILKGLSLLPNILWRRIAINMVRQ